MRTLARTTRLLRHAVDELFPLVIDSDQAMGESGSWQPDDTADYCVRCGRTVGAGERTLAGCSVCAGRRLPWQRMVRLSAYEGAMADCIRQMKFSRQWQWGPWLGRKLAEQVPAPVKADKVVVVPVPMFWFRRWMRGYNQAALIARALAEERHWLMVEALQRTRRTPPQTTVAPSQRAANVRGSFAVRAIDLAGHEVVLVDDVTTTGSTLAACCRLLRQMGSRSITVAVAAVAEHHT